MPKAPRSRPITGSSNLEKFMKRYGVRPTRRQTLILQKMSNGKTQREIALELGIVHQTVKNHLVELRRRINAKSSAHAVAIAIRQGWIY